MLTPFVEGGQTYNKGGRMNNHEQITKKQALIAQLCFIFAKSLLFIKAVMIF